MIKFFRVYVIATIITYLLTSFVVADMNFVNWNLLARFLTVAVAILVTIVIRGNADE